MELARLLDLPRGWLASEPGRLGPSLERFIGSLAYGVEALRSDLASFVFLLGGNDGEHFISQEGRSPQ